MKKVLFMVNNGKISPNENGGAAVYFSHLELLYKLGFQIHLLGVAWNQETRFKKEYFSEVETFVTSLTSYKIQSQITSNKIVHGWNALLKPEVFEYNFLNNTNKTYLQEFIIQNQIDFVWAEWRWAGLWAGFSKLSIPVFYSHHDWQFKIAKLRKKRNLLELFHIFQKIPNIEQ